MLGVLERSERSRVVVAIGEYKGRLRIDVRAWRKGIRGSDSWRPTYAGIALHPAELDAMIEALTNSPAPRSPSTGSETLEGWPMGTEFELPRELSARVGDFAAQTARSQALVQARRRLLFDLAGDLAASGEDPLVVRSSITTDVIGRACPGLDAPGSFDERLADAMLAAVDDALEGRPLGPLPPIYTAGDFGVSDGVYGPLSEAFARIANGPGRDDLGGDDA